jgi:hypothetical protein
MWQCGGFSFKERKRSVISSQKLHHTEFQNSSKIWPRILNQEIEFRNRQECRVQGTKGDKNNINHF